jgi:hypothetical protein
MYETYTVATIWPAGDGRLFPGSLSDVISDIKVERYGENVNSDAMKYAITHFIMLWCKFEGVGKLFIEYHRGAGSTGVGRVGARDVWNVSES